MPIILRFTPAPTDSTAFTKAVTVTADGQRAQGAWFWEKPLADAPVEAHYRRRGYWNAHAKIEVKLPISGLSAGPGLSYDGRLSSLSFSIGAANITTVDGAAEQMSVISDGVKKFSFPVSLGKAATPTYSGTKVVMELDKVQHMVGTPDDPYSLFVPWSVRLTTSGEFIHSASWNGGNIGLRSTSNGCTNLNTANAKTYFSFAQIGDIAIYTGTGGQKMPSWDGYGDWNVPWSQFSAGGLLRNH